MKKMPLNNLIIFDKHEEDLESLIQENWNEVRDLLRHNPELIKSNPKIKRAVTNYEIKFFSDLENQIVENLSFDDLEIFYILHKRKFHLLSGDRFKILVNKMIYILKNVDLHKAYKLAISFPDDKNCRTIIRDYENFITKKISHSQNKIVQITGNKNLSLIDGRRSLFKSAQEKEFFDAVRTGISVWCANKVGN